MAAILRKHGLAWAELDVIETALGKSVQLIMRRDSKQVVLLEIAAIGDQIVYSSAGNKPVLGGAAQHAEGKDKP
jgi:hypothetical protein